VDKSQVCDGNGDCADRSDEWECIQIENSTERLRIKTSNGDLRPVCSDGWTQTQSDMACQSLGYGYSALLETMPASVEQESFLLNDTSEGNLLSALKKNPAACESGQVVKLKCHDFSKYKP